MCAYMCVKSESEIMRKERNFLITFFLLITRCLFIDQNKNQSIFNIKSLGFLAVSVTQEL